MEWVKFQHFFKQREREYRTTSIKPSASHKGKQEHLPDRPYQRRAEISSVCTGMRALPTVVGSDPRQLGYVRMHGRPPPTILADSNKHKAHSMSIAGM